MSIQTTEDPLQLIEDALSVIVRRVQLPKVHERMLARAGLSLDRALTVVLSRIGELGPLRLSELAQVLAVDVSTASRQAASLERAGFVARELHPDDARSALLSLTPKGRTALQRLRRARREATEELFAHWTEKDRRRLGELLDRFAREFAAHTDKL